MTTIRFSARGLDLTPAIIFMVVAAAASLVIVGAGTLAWALVVTLVVALVVSLRHGTMRLLVAALPISFLFGPPDATINASPADFVLIFATFGCLLSLHGSDLDRPQAARIKTFLVYASAVLMVESLSLLWVGLLQSDSPLLTYAVLGMFKIVSVLVYFGVFLLYLTVHPEAFKDILSAWWWVSTIIVSIGAVVGMMNIFGIQSPLTDIMLEAYRLRGTLTDPNAFASYCILSLSLILVLRASKGQRAPILLTSVFMLAILLTGSRAAAPALIVAGLVVALTSAPMRKFLTPVVPSVLITAGLMYFVTSGPLQVEAFDRVGTGVESQGADDIRFLLWRTALDLWTNNPIFGVGIGQYQVAGEKFLGYPPGNIPHNTYLSLLAEFGIVGFIAVLSVPVLVGHQLYKLHRTKDIVASCLLIGFLTFAVQAMTLNLENFRPFWAFLGISLVYTSWARARQGAEAPAPSSAIPRSDSAASMRSAT